MFSALLIVNSNSFGSFFKLAGRQRWLVLILKMSIEILRTFGCQGVISKGSFKVIKRFGLKPTRFPLLLYFALQALQYYWKDNNFLLYIFLKDWL